LQSDNKTRRSHSHASKPSLFRKKNIDLAANYTLGPLTQQV